MTTGSDWLTDTIPHLSTNRKRKDVGTSHVDGTSR